jgi:hypothetical protein
MCPSLGKWAHDNLDPHEKAFAQKGVFPNSSAPSTFTGDYTRDDDIFVEKATSNLASAVYRNQLSSLSHGCALWDPTPTKEVYDRVSIGDVGYLHEGAFIRMFNVLLPWDHPSNGKFGKPEYYEPLYMGQFTNTLERQFDRIDHYSRSVSADKNADNMQTMRPDE